MLDRHGNMHRSPMTVTGNAATAAAEQLSRQRLKEAVWRIEGICSQLTLAEKIPQYKFRIIEAELSLLAGALGVPTLDSRRE